MSSQQQYSGYLRVGMRRSRRRMQGLCKVCTFTLDKDKNNRHKGKAEILRVRSRQWGLCDRFQRHPSRLCCGMQSYMLQVTMMQDLFVFWTPLYPGLSKRVSWKLQQGSLH